jgi:hypothetical protein
MHAAATAMYYRVASNSSISCAAQAFSSQFAPVKQLPDDNKAIHKRG